MMLTANGRRRLGPKEATVLVEIETHLFAMSRQRVGLSGSRVCANSRELSKKTYLAAVAAASARRITPTLRPRPAGGNSLRGAAMSPLIIVMATKRRPLGCRASSSEVSRRRRRRQRQRRRRRLKSESALINWIAARAGRSAGAALGLLTQWTGRYSALLIGLARGDRARRVRRASASARAPRTVLFAADWPASQPAGRDRSG